MTLRLVWDIEANGMADEADTVWCVCIRDIDSDASWNYGPSKIGKAIEVLDTADVLIGHNVLNYDHRVMQRIYGWYPKGKIIHDTLIYSRLCHSDLPNEDKTSPYTHIRKLNGSHSLKAWGQRLGEFKGEFGADITAWDEFTNEMLEYCAQDVVVNKKLYQHCESKNVPNEALMLEMEFAVISEAMSQRGFPFDRDRCVKLVEALSIRKSELVAELRSVFPARIEEMKTPQYYWVKFGPDHNEQFATKKAAREAIKLYGLRERDVTIGKGPMKQKRHEFKPSSRLQIKERLREKYDWVSPELTDKGRELKKKGTNLNDAELHFQYGSVSEDVLSSLDFDEAPLLCEYLMVDKRLGQAATGQNAWMKLVQPDGKIHHRMNTIGCSTFRCSHSGPNLGQVPSVMKGKDGKLLYGAKGKFGADCRACFTSSPGYVLVGIDLSGIESRLLGHFIQPFDGGKYIDTVLRGDIHQMNADAINKYAGVPVSRGGSKPLWYALSYGGGDRKLGETACGTVPESRAEYKHLFTKHCKKNDPEQASYLAYRDIGRRIRNALEKGITGMDKLLATVKTSAGRGYLTPLDRRKFPIRSEHSALNVLLQGSAAVVMKRWTVIAQREMREENLNAHILAIVHDEHQIEAVDDGKTPDRVISIGKWAIERAGKHYGLRIPLAGEACIGKNWAETH